MKAKILAILIILLATRVEAQVQINYGIPETSLSTSSTGAVTGTAFNLPTTYAAIVTWQVVADGSASSVNLEGSSDNINWAFLAANNTASGGILNYGFTAIKFIRCSQVSRTGGTASTCTLTVSRGLVTSTFPGAISAGNFLTNDGTTAAPAYSFLSQPNMGFFSATTNALGVGIGGNELFRMSTSGMSIFSDVVGLRLGASADTTLIRSGAGKVTLSGTTPMLQLGGTTSGSPALKAVGAALQVRLADDSGNGNITAANYFVNGSSGSIIGSNADGIITLSNNAVNDFGRLNFGGTTSAFPSLKRTSAAIEVRLADDSAYATLNALNLGYSLGMKNAATGSLLIFGAAPTISSGFGTSPSVPVNNGTASFIINVGTGGVATSGVIGLPTATNGWSCFATDITATANHTALETEMTASTTTTATIESQNRATGAATAWAASSLIRLSCFAY